MATNLTDAQRQKASSGYERTTGYISESNKVGLTTPISSNLKTSTTGYIGSLTYDQAKQQFAAAGSGSSGSSQTYYAPTTSYIGGTSIAPKAPTPVLKASAYDSLSDYYSALDAQRSGSSSGTKLASPPTMEVARGILGPAPAIPQSTSGVKIGSLTLDEARSAFAPKSQQVGEFSPNEYTKVNYAIGKLNQEIETAKSSKQRVRLLSSGDKAILDKFGIDYGKTESQIDSFLGWGETDDGYFQPTRGYGAARIGTYENFTRSGDVKSRITLPPIQSVSTVKAPTMPERSKIPIVGDIMDFGKGYWETGQNIGRGIFNLQEQAHGKLDPKYKPKAVELYSEPEGDTIGLGVQAGIEYFSGKPVTVSSKDFQAMGERYASNPGYTAGSLAASGVSWLFGYGEAKAGLKAAERLGQFSTLVKNIATKVDLYNVRGVAQKAPVPLDIRTAPIPADYIQRVPGQIRDPVLPPTSTLRANSPIRDTFVGWFGRGEAKQQAQVRTRSLDREFDYKDIVSIGTEHTGSKSPFVVVGEGSGPVFVQKAPEKFSSTRAIAESFGAREKDIILGKLPASSYGQKFSDVPRVPIRNQGDLLGTGEKFIASGKVDPAKALKIDYYPERLVGKRAGFDDPTVSAGLKLPGNRLTQTFRTALGRWNEDDASRYFGDFGKGGSKGDFNPFRKQGGTGGGTSGYGGRSQLFEEVARLDDSMKTFEGAKDISRKLKVDKPAKPFPGIPSVPVTGDTMESRLQGQYFTDREMAKEMAADIPKTLTKKSRKDFEDERTRLYGLMAIQEARGGDTSVLEQKLDASFREEYSGWLSEPVKPIKPKTKKQSAQEYVQDTKQIERAMTSAIPKASAGTASVGTLGFGGETGAERVAAKRNRQQFTEYDTVRYPPVSEFSRPQRQKFDTIFDAGVKPVPLFDEMPKFNPFETQKQKTIDLVDSIPRYDLLEVPGRTPVQVPTVVPKEVHGVPTFGIPTVPPPETPPYIPPFPPLLWGGGGGGGDGGGGYDAVIPGLRVWKINELITRAPDYGRNFFFGTAPLKRGKRSRLF